LRTGSQHRSRRSRRQKEADVHWNYALNVLWSTGQLRRARHELEEAARLAPAQGGVVLMTGQMRNALGDDAGALRLTNAAIALGADGEGRRVQQTYADVAARTGRYSDAASYMTRALPADIQSIGGGKTMELVYAAFGDPARRQQAITSLDSLLSKARREDWV